jgi:hypothetical protein
MSAQYQPALKEICGDPYSWAFLVLPSYLGTEASRPTFTKAHRKMRGLYSESTLILAGIMSNKIRVSTGIEMDQELVLGESEG